ncbi:amidohydrolase family protein [Temperatibacter marinus]|uniref:Amidohydrolase family protein n=1 Tax=Temperatibacter marinus TaxID=1456591 RepID=A0AA52EBW8_9PROT|nr:amidohydrolase family protein [Temperatibacter marinus]WND02522.1 amidohydrolase family protein [Temperatibacter marinus]
MFKTIIISLCLLSITAAPPTAIDQTCRDGQTIIENVTIIYADKVPLKNAYLSYDNKQGVITALSSDPIPKANACDASIDGSNQFLTAGLTEMHGHLPYSNWDKKRTEETLFLYVAAGVTTVRGMLGDPVQFHHRDQIIARELEGPNLYLAAPSLNGTSVTSPEQGRQLVRRYKEEGWDLLKIHPGLTAEEYDAIADEGKKVDIKLGGHVPSGVGLQRVLQAQQASIDHMDGYWQYHAQTQSLNDSDALMESIEKTKTSGTAIVPTQLLFNLLRSGADVKALIAREENKYMPKSQISQWAGTAQRLKAQANPAIAAWRDMMLKKMADEGVVITLGSDAPQIFSVPGFSIWRELKKMQDIGLTRAQILKAAGPAPGAHLAYSGDKFGKIEVGHRADLLLLSANPLVNITNLSKQNAVIVRGKLYTKDYIDQKLMEIEARHR